MAGREYLKVRTIVSQRLISPLSGRKDFNSAAREFAAGVRTSSLLPVLNADIAVKAALGGTSKPTYEDTDGKKRSSSSGPAGMVELDNGWRLDPNATYEEGKTFKFFPSETSKQSHKKEFNFGWVDKKKNLTIREWQEQEKSRPKPRFRKYSVNKRTGEIDEQSEVELDPFSVNGETLEENNKAFQPETKVLPGRPLSSRIPGGGLLARAAARFGIIVDENNKLRCPPGTPAANQFTDAFGSNCFGISSSRIVNFALDKAFELGGGEKYSGFRNTVSNVLGFLYDLDNGKYGGLLARNVWYDGKTGERIKDIRKWRDVNLPEETRFFKNGMANAQDRLRVQDERLSKLYDRLGVIRTPSKAERNQDVIEAFDEMKKVGIWDGQIYDRPTAGQVDAIVKTKLQEIPGFDELPLDRQKVLIDADTKRYYENERAMLESFMEFVLLNPGNAKDIKVINFENKGDGDEASAAAFGWGKSGIQGTSINLDIPIIMRNQEAMLPSLKPYERLRVDMIGARTESEAASSLADFMTSANQAARATAGLVDGPRSFARHIMVHEIAHTIQIMAFADEIKNQIASKGFVTVRGPKGNPIQIDDARKLTSSHIMQIMKKVGDDVDLDSMKESLSRTEVLAVVAGRYPAEIFDDINIGGGSTMELWGLEAQAELYALRDLGLIDGDDIDAALSYMDDRIDAGHARRRKLSDSEDFARLEEMYFAPVSPEAIPEPIVEDVKARQAAETRQELDDFRKRVSELQEDDMIAIAAELSESLDGMQKAIDEARESGLNDSDLTERARVTLARYERVEKAWKKKYGIESQRDKSFFRDKVGQYREDNGMFSDEIMQSRTREREIGGMLDEAGEMSEDELVRRLADYEVQLSDSSLPDESRKLLTQERKIYKKAWDELQREKDDELTKRQRERNLEKEIQELVRPARTTQLKKVTNFKSNRKAEEYASEQRSSLLKNATTQERIAIVELADTNNSKIAKLLDPDSQVAAGKAITKRNRRLKRLGMEIDPTNKEQAAIDEQVESILIPAMTLMDKSSISDDIEMEASVDFDIDMNTGEILIGGEVGHESFITGRMLNSREKHVPGVIEPGVGQGKSRRKTVIQVAKGDKGMFPHWSFDKDKDDGEQKLTIPPGKLQIVAIRDDGTIVARVKEQKNTSQVLDSLVSSMGEEGGLPNQNAKGTRAKVKRVVDKYAAESPRGKSSVSSANSPDIERRNSDIVKSVSASGDSFGTAPSAEYVKKVKTDSDDVFGKAATKRERTASRRKGINDSLDSVDSVMSGKEAKNMPELAKDSVDPQVANIISSTPREQLVQIVEDTAKDMHDSFDRRVRVRATEKDIEDIARSGAMRPSSLDSPRQPINQQEVSQQYAGFTTSSGSKYVYGQDGKVSREKNPLTSTTIDDGIVRSSFDNTRFVSEEDLKGLQVAFDRGIPFGEDGSIRALKYDKSSMDMERFLSLRKSGVAFDDAWIQSGGTIQEYRPETSLEPTIGKHPFEWDETGKRWHAGSEVSSVDSRPGSGSTSETRRAARRSKSGKSRKANDGDVLSSTTPPEKPKRPREPDNGPFTGKFAEVFKGSKSYQEMLDRYNNLEVVFFDYETTGFDPADGNMPVQIGAVRMKGGKVLGRFNVFVNPGRPLGDWAKKNLKDADGNPLTDEYLSKMPTVRDAHEQLVSFFGPDALLGGQYTPFDLEVLNRMLKQEGIDYSPAGVIDSKAISDEILPRWTPESPIGPKAKNEKTGEFYGSNSLGPLSDYLGVELKNWHTADADADASAMVTQKLLELAARGEATSQEMLDVDGMPDRQRRKKEQFEIDLAEYKKLKKEYDDSVANTKNVLSSGDAGNRTNRPVKITQTIDTAITDVNRGKLRKDEKLSSGSVNRNLTNGSIKGSPRTIESSESFTRDYLNLQETAQVYEIGNEKVVFGASGDATWDEDVVNVPVNPYEISGYDMTSDEGRNIAMKWTAAHAASMDMEPRRETTYVDSLLYAGSRGDELAMQKFDELAEIGERKIQDERENRYERDLNEEELADIARERMSDLSVDDLFLVHETKYDFPVDDDGNIVIRPLGDYELTSDSGEKIRYERDTVHFALNHLAQGHLMRQRSNNSKIVIVPLKDVLDRNNGSLDTLYSVDTYLTPKPGEGILLPAGRYRTIDVGDGDGVDEKVSETLKDMGARHIFEPGEYGSSRGADAAVYRVARDLGANFGTHSNLPHSSIEAVNRKDPSTPRGVQYEVTASQLARLSDNSRMRIAKTDRWSGSLAKVKMEDDALFSGGASRGRVARTAKGGITSRVAGRLIDSALKRSGADEDTRDMVEFGMGVATAFAAGGPAGAIAMVAKEAATRGGRDLAEYTLNEMVKRGKISESQAQVAMRQVSKYAPEGLPEPVKEKLRDGFEVASDFYDMRIDTPENRERISDAASEVRGRISKRASSIRERIGAAVGRGGDSGEFEVDAFGDVVPKMPSKMTPAVDVDWDPFGDSLSSGGTTRGRAAANLRKEYEKRIGLSSGNRANRPVYGYLAHKSHIEQKKKTSSKKIGKNIDGSTPFEVGDSDVLGDGLTALGEIEIVLKPEVSNRTAYGRGDSLSSGVRPVMMNSSDKQDIADAILNPAGHNSDRERFESVIHTLNAHVDKNYANVNAGLDKNGKMARVGGVDSADRARVPFEAQILGGFRADEIESINYPYSKVVANSSQVDVSDVLEEKTLKDKLSSLGFTDEEIAYFYSIGGADSINTNSIQKLKEYRAARKAVAKLDSLGIARVEISHPDGVSILDPLSYDPSANPNVDAETVIRKNIDDEVNQYLEKMLKGIRSGKVVVS